MRPNRLTASNRRSIFPDWACADELAKNAAWIFVCAEKTLWIIDAEQGRAS
jgi:hypothetical protein